MVATSFSYSPPKVYHALFYSNFLIMALFIKYYKSDEAAQLLSNMAANHLLSVIAQRASFKGNLIEGIKKGESPLGDFEKIGMTRGQYRTALENLIKWGYITTRTTNKGTVAKLANFDTYALFEIDQQPPTQPSSNHQATIKQPSSNHQATIKQPSSNHQATTIQEPLEYKNRRIEEQEHTPTHEKDFLKSSPMWVHEIETYSTYTNLHAELKTAVRFYLDDQEEKEKRGITTSMVKTTLMKVQGYLGRFDYKQIATSLYNAVQKSNKDFNPAWNESNQTDNQTESKDPKIAHGYVMGKQKIFTGKC